MKVLFVISVLREGKGGHYHSLKHISQVISKHLDCRILSFGPNHSKIIESLPQFEHHIETNLFSIVSFGDKLNKILKEFEPEIIHCFDVNSYNFIKLFTKNKKFAIVLNKCGGMNPPDFPKVENLVLFSEENKKWFESIEKFNQTNIMLIPNRVNKLILSEIGELKKDPNNFTFVRIARIGDRYRKSILDSINLINYLFNQKQLKVKLIIIGAVYQKEVFNEIIDLIKDKQFIEIYTDDKFTTEASKQLYLADAVIATGRGVMEVSSLELPVLTPASNSEYPILINESNFFNFFGTNFSERNEASRSDINSNLNSVVELITNAIFRKKYSDFSKSMFDQYFNVENSFSKYFQMYEMAILNKKTVGRFSDFGLRIRNVTKLFVRVVESKKKN